MANFLKSLFGVLKQPATRPLYFKDGAAAFEYACQFLHAELQESVVLPALVQDARDLLGAEEPIVRMKDGSQMLALRVCSKDGGFLVLAGTLSAVGPSLKPGDLVAWQAGKPITRESPELQKDPRSGWVGIALAQLKPEYIVGRGWAIQEPFRQ